MKKLFIYIGIIIPLFWSCTDYLDYTEDSYYDVGIFDEFSLTKNFLSNIYSDLPSDFNSIDGAMRESATDNATHVNNLPDIKIFYNGSWSPLQVVDDKWEKLYSGIRASNLFLTEADSTRFSDIIYNSGYPQLMEQFRLYPYEARFLRAFFYFELIKRYGDVPVVTTVLSDEETIDVTQTPFNQVVDFIVSECNAISDKLPENYINIPGKETGRPTKGAALALKARILLYAASPLHNPDNNQQKWIDAAMASKTIIDANLYSLENQYSDIVNNISSGELIFETRQNASNYFENSNFPIGYEGGNTGTCPTQNLVDAYEMKESGLKISDDGSGYDITNPYVGRDPRMDATILYNGSQWKNEDVQCWLGGRNAPPKDRATVTGYYLKKYLIESISLSPTNPTTAVHTWVLFRYGEVLLNYAEAMNEAFGPNTAPNPLQMTAYVAVNLIRNRAGMPEFPLGMTKESFREKLRNERRVELAFEDHRFWDIRRWEIGNSTTEIYGVNISKDSSEELQYTRKLVDTRIWHDKMYFYPIPQNELSINGKISQNPLW